MPEPITMVQAEAALARLSPLGTPVHERGARLTAGFRGARAYLQAQRPGHDEALRVLRADLGETVRYLTEDQEPDVAADDPEGYVSPERFELAMVAAEMRLAIDAMVRDGAGFRLTNDGKRAWVSIRPTEGAPWVRVLVVRKGRPPQTLSAQEAAALPPIDPKAVARGERTRAFLKSPNPLQNPPNAGGNTPRTLAEESTTEHLA